MEPSGLHACACFAYPLVGMSKTNVVVVILILLVSANLAIIDFNYTVQLGNDQRTLFYAYPQAFSDAFHETGRLIGWNPWISSGSSEFSNLPFPFSL